MHISKNIPRAIFEQDLFLKRNDTCTAHLSKRARVIISAKRDLVTLYYNAVFHFLFSSQVNQGHCNIKNEYKYVTLDEICNRNTFECLNIYTIS